MAIVVLVPVAIVSATELAFSALAAVAGGIALALGQAHPTFHPTEPAGPGPEIPKPRNVTQGEQNLAHLIADELDREADDCFAHEEWAADPSQPVQAPSPNVLALRGAATQYRTITTAMLAVEAATIAAPGIAHLQSAQAYILTVGVIAAPLAATIVDAQRLLASLATIGGTV
jgi:hypothetical protein